MYENVSMKENKSKEIYLKVVFSSSELLQRLFLLQ